jgi:putative tricarboxylic transport membrane protein
VSDPGARAPNGLRLDWAELVVAAVLIAFAAIVAWDAFHMRAGVAAYSRIGPRAFPYGIAAGLLALGVATVLVSLRTPPPEREQDDIRPMLWIVAGLLLQIILLKWAGFSIATGAVFAMTARAFGRGPLWLTYPAGVIFALLLWLFFSQALKLVLPAGPLETFVARAISGAF